MVSQEITCEREDTKMRSMSVEVWSVIWVGFVTTWVKLKDEVTDDNFEG